ncbi:hypothetical protein BJX70DRAFT_358684 [Aspergillus crustosus]
MPVFPRVSMIVISTWPASSILSIRHWLITIKLGLPWELFLTPSCIRIDTQTIPKTRCKTNWFAPRGTPCWWLEL